MASSEAVSAYPPCSAIVTLSTAIITAAQATTGVWCGRGQIVNRPARQAAVLLTVASSKGFSLPVNWNHEESFGPGVFTGGEDLMRALLVVCLLRLFGHPLSDGINDITTNISKRAYVLYSHTFEEASDASKEAFKATIAGWDLHTGLRALAERYFPSR